MYPEAGVMSVRLVYCTSKVWDGIPDVFLLLDLLFGLEMKLRAHSVARIAGYNGIKSTIFRYK